LLEF